MTTGTTQTGGERDGAFIAQMRRLTGVRDRTRSDGEEVDGGTARPPEIHRAALAELRRTAGKTTVGEATGAHRYVQPYISGVAGREEERYYLVAALVALHPEAWPENEDAFGGLGASFRELRGRVQVARGETASEPADDDRIDPAEKRFMALLATDAEELPDALRHAVSLLRAHDVPVNWRRLLRDLRWWEDEQRSVQRRWAREFWGARRAADARVEDSGDGGNTTRENDDSDEDEGDDG